MLLTTNVMPPNFEQMSIAAVVRASIQQMLQREMDSLRSLDNSAMVINTDASMQGVGISWRERRRQALRTPIRETFQISRESVDDFMAQGRHNGWAQSTEVIQRSTMTKRRARTTSRCRSHGKLVDSPRVSPSTSHKCGSMLTASRLQIMTDRGLQMLES